MRDEQLIEGVSIPNVVTTNVPYLEKDNSILKVCSDPSYNPVQLHVSESSETCRLHSAQLYFVMVDECCDVSNQEQVVIFLRWVDNNYIA